MRIDLVFGVVGQLLRLYAVAFVPPMLLALADGEVDVALHFGVASAASYVFGTMSANDPGRQLIFQRSEALAVVSLTWLMLAVMSAIPYVFAGVAPVDALFESMSGLTTTGATIFTDFGAFGRAIFLWRAMTQWFGGLGVIALFLVVLPRLGIAGRQLFFAEASSAPGEAISPQIRKSSSSLWILYSAMTLILCLLLLFAGMPFYDALLHALTTLPAGGFSPHALSIAGYDNPLAEWILVIFMLLAGTSFTLQYRVYVAGDTWGFVRDGEFRLYFLATVFGSLAIAAELSGGMPTLESLRIAAFQAASVISSTGYASTDFNLWNDATKAVLIVLMVVSGCAGSAAGGPKSIRWVLVFKRVAREIRRVLHPRAVLPMRYGEQPVSEDIMRAVFNLVVLYVAGYFLFGIAMVLLGADLVTGFSAALACLGNIGPGFGPAGPMGSFAGFSVTSKLLLTFAMWIGRLEIVTVLALLHPDVWRHVRLSE